MCRDKLDWDDPLPESLEFCWNCWLSELASLDQIQIPRNYLPPVFGAIKSVELHHYSDASTVGYGQVSYLRFEDTDGNFHSTLVMAKGRITPIRLVTVPRLELCAAVLSVKVARFLESELDYESMRHFFWTDSQIVLAYLRNVSKRFHVFVANRVQQILQFSKADQWGFVPSKDNPADHASRGLDVKDLVASNWYGGPASLLSPHDTCDIEFFEIPADDVEVKSCGATDATEVTFTSFEDRVKRFSSKSSLFKGVALMVRKCAERKGNHLSKLESLRVAEKKLTLCIQRESFSRPSASLRNSLGQLNCFKDNDGILRVGVD